MGQSYQAVQLVGVWKNDIALEERIDLSPNYRAVFPKHPNYRDLSSCMVLILQVATLIQRRSVKAIPSITLLYCTEKLGENGLVRIKMKIFIQLC